MSTLHKAMLLFPPDMMACRDRRVWLSCESWVNSIPTQQPLCLLCPHEWLDQKDYQRTVGAFYVVLPEMPREGDVMVAAVCQTCTDAHGEGLYIRCYEQLNEDCPGGVDIVPAPHETTQ